MALINTKMQWLYLFEPHTASRATFKMLRDHAGGCNIGHHHIGVEELTNWRREHIASKRLKGFDILATVRNPFDVLVTRWKFGPGSEEKFEDWAWENRDHIIVSRALRGLWKDANIWCYYEDLEEDIRWVFGKIGTDPAFDDFRLPFNQAHKTGGKAPWNTYYECEKGHRLFDYLMKGEYGAFASRFGYEFTWDGETLLATLDRDVRKLRTQEIKLVRRPEIT